MARPQTSSLPGGKGNALQGQLHLLEVLVSYFRGHRAVLAWELDTAGARDQGALEDWRELLPAARQADPRHPIALGLSGDCLLRGDRALLEDLAPGADLLVLGWPSQHRLAPRAIALAQGLTGRRTLIRLEHVPSDDERFEDLLRKLHRAGALGVLLPLAPEDGGLGAGPSVFPPPSGRRRRRQQRSQISSGAWPVIQRIAAEDWRVEAEPPAIVVDPKEFYRDPRSGWRSLGNERTRRS